VVALRNTAGDGERTLLVVANLGAEPVALPEGEVLVASGPLTVDGAVPTDTTAWLRLPVA
jgi:alpha-glucosidase